MLPGRLLLPDQLRGSISPNLLIGQPETLPNIKSGSCDFFNYNHHAIAINLTAAGAIVVDNISENNTAGWAGGETRINYNNAFYLDASKTTGTGKGVYKDGAHVQPSYISVKTWLRLA